MSVRMGSAHGDENGKAVGGKAGDQTGREVSLENWYLHSKGWTVLRAKDAAAREKIAKCMEMACANDRIGYDQYQRNTLYKAAEVYGFDVSKVTENVETDCSALVRVCCAFAGILLPDYNTASQVSTFRTNGSFEILTDGKYCKQDAYLKRGDILVTNTKGHTVVVLSNGASAGSEECGVRSEECRSTIRKGSKGEDVLYAQKILDAGGLDTGGLDGDFGSKTETAVKIFQANNDLEHDGVVGPLTWAVLEKAAAALKDESAAASPVSKGKTVKVLGNTVFVRKGPGKEYGSLGVVVKGDELDYLGETSENGWYKVRFISWIEDPNGASAWISGKYAELQ